MRDIALPAENEVHVWGASLPQFGAQTAQFLPLLSADELDRSARLRLQQDRVRFIVARGLLRRLLATYLGRPPESLRFTEGVHGKPMLLDCDQDLRFNLSHSGQRLLYAVARGREVGVDVEAENPELEWVSIAKSFFAPEEWNALTKLGHEQGKHAFMALWSCKEALHKAIGAGFYLAADKVPLPLGRAALQVSAQTLAGDDELWSIRRLEQEPGYYAAVAAQGDGVRISCKEM